MSKFVVRRSNAPLANKGSHVEALSVNAAKVSSNVASTGSVLVAESASQSSPSPGSGRLWVRNDTPNKLVFTDDAGTDTDLGGGGGGYGEETMIVIGQNATHDSISSGIAIGGSAESAGGANVTAINGIAIGASSNASPLNGALAGGSGSIAIGSSVDTRSAMATDYSAIAIGGSNTAGTRAAAAVNYGAIAIGAGTYYNGAYAQGVYSIAIGQYARVTGDFNGCVVIGKGSYAAENSCVSIGRYAYTTGQKCIAIGDGAFAHGDGALGLASSVAIGDSANATEAASIAIGRLAQTTGANSIAIGNQATAAANNLAIRVGSTTLNTDLQVATSAPGAATRVWPVTIGGVDYHIHMTVAP